MVSVEGLGKVNDLINNNVGAINQQNEYSSLQDVAGQASELAKNGDFPGAYGLLMKAAPSKAEQWMGDLQKAHPELHQQLAEAQRTGDLKAEKALGSSSIPVQVARIGADGRIKAAEQKAASSEDKLKQVELANGVKGYISERDLKAGNNSNIKIPAGQAQVVEGSDGQKVSLGKKQVNDLKPFITDFKKQADKFDESIDGGQMFQQLVQGNLPGSKLPAIMKFLTSEEGVKRFNSDEFHEMGKPGDIAQQVSQLIQQKTNGKPWTKDQQAFMTNVAKTMEFSTFNSYIDKIESSSKGAAKFVGSDPEAIKKIIGANAHPLVQKVLEHVQEIVKQDPQPKEALKAIDWARHNFSNPDAKKILAHYGLYQ